MVTSSSSRADRTPARRRARPRVRGEHQGSVSARRLIGSNEAAPREHRLTPGIRGD
jgi:hypothetical protein